jgi:polyhydroxyalkanoate synthesis regulator protein
MYGDSMQSMVPQYLEASLDSFQRNQTQFRDAMAGALSGGPFADLAKRNMELFAAAATGGVKPANAEGEAGGGRDDELARLKAELAALQAKVDKLAG